MSYTTSGQLRQLLKVIVKNEQSSVQIGRKKNMKLGQDLGYLSGITCSTSMFLQRWRLNLLRKELAFSHFGYVFAKIPNLS